MPYTPEKPKLPESTDELRARIPGWGVDLDPKDRPSVPREKFDPNLSGARWDFPERQAEKWPRERSIEHQFVTPVFGTSCPPKGLSGAIRKFSYRRYSEARAAHWLLLLAADRVDAVESALGALLRGRPDNPVTETGVLSEFTHHGVASRIGRKRADLAHHPLDPVIVAAPWVAVGAVAYSLLKRAAGRRGADRSRPGPPSCRRRHPWCRRRCRGVPQGVSTTRCVHSATPMAVMVQQAGYEQVRGG